MSGLIVCAPYYVRVVIENLGRGLIASSLTGAKTVWSYRYVDEVVVAVTSLTSAHRESGSAFGNLVTGIFAGGAYVVLCDRYTYGTDVVVGGFSISAPRLYPVGIGNLTYGIVACGRDTNVNNVVGTVDRYTYSVGTFVQRGVLAPAMYMGYGLNASTYGVIMMSSTVTLKYTYASEVTVSVASLGNGLMAVFGTLDVGYAYQYNLGKMQGYWYASNTVTSTSALGTNRSFTVGVGNGVVGIIAGGNAGGTYVGLVERYDCMSLVMTMSTSLPESYAYGCMAVSTNPGHL